MFLHAAAPRQTCGQIGSCKQFSSGCHSAKNLCPLQVFSEPGLVLEMFMSRLLEQNVQAALERLLLPSGECECR